MELTVRHRPSRIISGGQTGADQAGLAAAQALRIRTGGWAPRGWRTDDGPAPWLAEFGLQEHASHLFPPRTRANVREADGSVWFGRTDSPGYRCTAEACRSLGRTMIENPTPEDLRRYLTNLNDFPCLNVAGNRERTNPGIFEHAVAVLLETLA